MNFDAPEVAARLAKAKADRAPISSVSASLAGDVVTVTADRLGGVELGCA